MRSAWGLEVDREMDWRQRAACGPDTAELFFVEYEHVGRGLTKANQSALRICHGCPVRAQCDQDAQRHPEPYTRIAGGRVVRAVRLASQRRQMEKARHG